YFDHPGFVTPFVEGVREALVRLDDALGRDADLARDAHVLFVTHSIPTDTALTSGPPGAQRGPEGTYGAQRRPVAEVVMASVGTASDVGTGGRAARFAEVPWSLVYQSRSGAPTTPWLEPDVNDAIVELAAQGTRAVVVVPVGFVSDHMEVLWDLDEEAVTTARDAGLLAERVPTPGVHPAFVTGLVDLVEERLARTDGTTTGGASVTVPGSRPALSPLGPWYDVCPAGCCANPRGDRPALAGRDR